MGRAAAGQGIRFDVDRRFLVIWQKRRRRRRRGWVGGDSGGINKLSFFLSFLPICSDCWWRQKRTRRSKRIKSFPSFTIVESETSNSRYYYFVTYKRRWRQLQRMLFSIKSYVRFLRLLSWALDLRLRKSLLNLNTIVSQVTLHNSACVMWGERRLFCSR